LQQDLPTAVQLFQKALTLDYAQHPIGYVYNDHLPEFLRVTTVHVGQGTSDPSLIAKGDEMLDYSVYQFPEFNNFNRCAPHNSTRCGRRSMPALEARSTEQILTSGHISISKPLLAARALAGLRTAWLLRASKG
jgi:hypothetical protein